MALQVCVVNVGCIRNQLMLELHMHAAAEQMDPTAPFNSAYGLADRRDQK
jgi:hypothetical protein